MSDVEEVRKKLLEEAEKALHRKGIDPASCACPGRKHRLALNLERIEEVMDPNAPERKMTPYLSVACRDCGKAQLYVLPLLIGTDFFNKIAGSQLGVIV